MKQKPVFFAILCCTLFSLACKKDSSTQQTQPPSKDISISLTREQMQNFQSLILTGQIKDSTDFYEKIKLVKSIQPKIALDDPAGSDAPGTDADNEAAMGFGNVSTRDNVPDLARQVYPDQNPNTFVAWKSIFERNEHFPIRGNTINIQIPFTVTTMQNNLQPNSIMLATVSATNGAKVIMTGASAGWGTITQGVNNYINFVNGNGIPGQGTVNAHGDLDELRTEIFSTQGTIKVSTTTNLAAFTVGTELGSNFTISSANNIMNHYTMDATLGVTAQGGYNTPSPSAPALNYTYGISVTDAGVLLNQ